MDNFRLKISVDEMKLLKKYAPLSYDKLIPADDDIYEITVEDYSKIESDIDDAIVRYGLTANQDNLNSTGKKLQDLYDNLYSQH